MSIVVKIRTYCIKKGPLNLIKDYLIIDRYIIRILYILFYLKGFFIYDVVLTAFYSFKGQNICFCEEIDTLSSVPLNASFGIFGAIIFFGTFLAFRCFYRHNTEIIIPDNFKEGTKKLEIISDKLDFPVKKFIEDDQINAVGGGVKKIENVFLDTPEILNEKNVSPNHEIEEACILASDSKIKLLKSFSLYESENYTANSASSFKQLIKIVTEYKTDLSLLNITELHELKNVFCNINKFFIYCSSAEEPKFNIKYSLEYATSVLSSEDVVIVDNILLHHISNAKVPLPGELYITKNLIFQDLSPLLNDWGSFFTFFYFIYCIFHYANKYLLFLWFKINFLHNFK